MRWQPIKALTQLAMIMGRKDKGNRSAVNKAMAGNTMGAVKSLPAAEYTQNVVMDT